MRIILTHEQADFDAVGALLGARLLQENDLAVLPRRFNRNVRAFLALYGADLPFMDPRDLPQEAIDAVLLVDTQSLVTLKGLTADTQVRVIDHHTQRTDLPEGWNLLTDPVGAITTLFVEALLENDLSPTPIQATLMLIGIYEDTGSLTYGSTTARDIRAAANLLDMGASLSIMAHYLNPPLSADQRRVYDRLMASAVAHTIHGQRVVVTCGSAEDMNEEISSVAHKLRDLLEPDALFLLVITSEGVRLVARSTTNRINVAAVAAEFGGGGHERAAAALIHADPSKPAVTKEELLQLSTAKLLDILPRHVQPAVRVGQIMSRRPRLIPPETSVEEALKLMQRYGYEGYPVIQAGKIIGLLTRRAVDRAMAHRLNLTAASLMEAGEFTIQPADSIDTLQQIMTVSGWGQVPVVDPQTGSVVGIVTRTDLLKTLASRSNPPARENLSEKLEAALPPARVALLRAVAAQAQGQHAPVYVVGGFVRDLLLDRPGLDYDVVVEGDAIALARALVGAYGGSLVSHARFGTAKWTISAIREALARQINGGTVTAEELPDSLDLISARSEFYERPTALPTVERGSIKLDLHRRDFTINTLALRLDGSHYGELFDYWGGLADLRRGAIRVLHSLSFIDDPTRLLRAVRFEQRFGFHIEKRTLELIAEGLDLLRQVSGDRLRHELNLILAEERAPAMIARLHALGILAAIHPDLPPALVDNFMEKPPEAWSFPDHFGNLPAELVIAYLVWLAPLNPGQMQSIAARLRLPGDLCSAMVALAELRIDLADLAGLKPSQLVARLEGTPVAALYALFLCCQGSPEADCLAEYLGRWMRVRPSLTGDDLIQLGVTPGPAYRTILQKIRAAWLDGEITSESEERQLLKDLVENGGPELVG
jgi:tRNA nucleotidyltransferase (CCA-adding enzyme)